VTYVIFATAADYFAIRRGAPPSRPNWTVIRPTPPVIGHRADVMPVTDGPMDEAQKDGRIANQKSDR
jgi:hypothetical protein